MLSSGAVYVSGFVMSEKQRKAIRTVGGKERGTSHDGIRPITQAAASYIECLLN